MNWWLKFQLFHYFPACLKVLLRCYCSYSCFFLLLLLILPSWYYCILLIIFIMFQSLAEYNSIGLQLEDFFVVSGRWRWHFYLFILLLWMIKVTFSESIILCANNLKSRPYMFQKLILSNIRGNFMLCTLKLINPGLNTFVKCSWNQGRL